MKVLCLILSLCLGAVASQRTFRGEKFEDGNIRRFLNMGRMDGMASIADDGFAGGGGGGMGSGGGVGMRMNKAMDSDGGGAVRSRKWIQWDI
jgi:hypothetical protein